MPKTKRKVADEMEKYDLNQLALITGLTTRTLRNYLNQGILEGEKLAGNWHFSEENLEKFFSSPEVKRSLTAKRHALVYDFMADTYKKNNRICMILDFPVAQEEANTISDLFCSFINEKIQDIQFKFHYDVHGARVILSGAEDAVMDVIYQYYGK